MVSLMETRVKVHNSDRIVKNKFANWGFFHNYKEAYNGRIWILWKQHVNMVRISSIDQCITCRVTINNNEMVISFVYASNNAQERKNLWSYLLETANMIDRDPLMVLGDFNVLLSLEETSKYDGIQILT